MSNLQGISPKVPLVYDSTDGPYQLNKNLKQTFSQNLKMLILTMPGERIMVPNFGVGLQGFLFEGVTEEQLRLLLHDQLKKRHHQVHLPDCLLLRKSY